MLNRVFPQHSDIHAAVGYLLSNADHTGTERLVEPRILQGRPERVLAIARTMNCRSVYTSGVLSFAESNIPLKTEQAIVREHLRVSFPGLSPSRVAALYVRHRDKGISEIHYVLVNLDLQTGKRLTGYYLAADCSRMRAWVLSVHDRFKLEDP